MIVLDKKIGTANKMVGRELLEYMRVPPKHWQATLSKIPDTCPHKEPVETWLKGVKQNVLEGRGLLLAGDYGQGKSAIAAMAIKAAAAEGILGLWLKAADFAYSYLTRAEFDEEVSVYEHSLRTKVLVIDELDLHVDNRVLFMIDALVRKRTDNNLCTVITTNHDTAELQKLHPAMAAVLRESVYPIVVRGHNFRDEIAKDIDGSIREAARIVSDSSE